MNVMKNNILTISNTRRLPEMKQITWNRMITILVVLTALGCGGRALP